MSDAAHEALCTALDKYLNANDYMPERFKAQLTDFAHVPRNGLLKDGLRAAIDGSTVAPEAFEGLTNCLIDTQDEVDAWLAALWAFVYEDGPEPDLPG